MVHAMWRRSGLRIVLVSLAMLTAPAALVSVARAQPPEGDDGSAPASDESDADSPSGDDAPEAPEPSKEELAAARKLFKEGISLEKEGDWVTALGKFQAVTRVTTTPQVRFHIALCEENLGRWVAAIEGFEQAGQLAEEVGEEAAKVARNAPARAEALRKKIPHITLTLQGQLLTSVVKLDGAPVERGALDSSIPVDVGTHVVSVENGDEVTFREEITLGERDEQTVRVIVRDAKADTDEAVEPPPPPATEPPSRMPAVLVAGVGVTSLIVAGAFVGLRQAALGDVEDTCKDPDNLTGCAPSSAERADDGKRAEVLAFVFGGLGVASLATAGVLWFVVLAPEDSSPPAGTSRALLPSRLEVGASPTGVLVRGQFF